MGRQERGLFADADGALRMVRPFYFCIYFVGIVGPLIYSHFKKL